MGHTHGVDSEVGRLRTVLAHRPGAELLRITPRTRDRLGFPGQPWVALAQQEHDIAAQCRGEHRGGPARRRARQWDDGGNALALGPRLMLCYEGNVETNARLEAAGAEVIRIPGSELGGARGGPRALSCAVHRDSAVESAPAAAPR